MRTVKFNSEEEFLKELDGKVYAISDKGGEFLCDILEDDFCKLLDSGDIINLCDTSVDYGQRAFCKNPKGKRLRIPLALAVGVCQSNINAYSDYIISSGVDEDKFKEMYGVEIEC